MGLPWIQLQRTLIESKNAAHIVGNTASIAYSLEQTIKRILQQLSYFITYLIHDPKFRCIQHPVIWKAYVPSAECQEDMNDPRFLLPSAKTCELSTCKRKSGHIQQPR